MNERRRVQEHVAAEVRANLARQRLSGRSAALRLGWTPPYLSRRLTGAVPFDVADLAAIADLLEVPVTSFFQDQKASIVYSIRPRSSDGHFARAA